MSRNYVIVVPAFLLPEMNYFKVNRKLTGMI